MQIGHAAQMLLDHKRILILCHKSPDGDTLGSGFALYYALLSLGKQAQVLCHDNFPPRYNFLYPEDQAPVEKIKPDLIVAVDVADTQLLGEKLEPLVPYIDLCIDHHPSNVGYAKNTLVEICAATTEVIYQVILAMGVKLDAKIAGCIYTGLATDTGCFKFTNTTARTHRIAAEMMEAGAPYGMINTLMFDTKSPARIAVEREVYNTLDFYYGGRCALVAVTHALMEQSGADEYEIEGISALPRQIAGVDVGATIQERPGGCKVSFRTSEAVDATALAQTLGGGGHARAAGCFLKVPVKTAKEMVVAAVGKALGS